MNHMRKKEKIGEFLVRIEAMTKEQCEKILKMQEEGDTRLFGEIANALGYVNKAVIKEFLHITCD